MNLNRKRCRKYCVAAALTTLAAHARAAYMIGPQEELKLLLNQSNPTNLGRTLAYYRYFAQERSRKIEAIRAARAAAAADRC